MNKFNPKKVKKSKKEVQASLENNEGGNNPAAAE